MQNYKIPVQNQTALHSFFQKLKLCFKIMKTKKVVVILKTPTKINPHIYTYNYSQDDLIKLSGDIYVKLVDIKYTCVIDELINNDQTKK